ncbi:hypothetical protein R1sor_012663 [Riccia sorocarpa]|uniref:Uncharacterized protein n=1 Tax=Riccia sorocarpa TaxID=122646 RepID=A0ABD3I724_9MARC
MVYNHTRESLDRTRGDDFRSPLKKKSRAPGEDEAARMASTANSGGGAACKDNVGNAANNVIPDPVEENREEAAHKDPPPSWKAITQKSLLERHPGWANAHKVINEPNPYVRGLKADEGSSVTSTELKEVVQDVNSHINVSEYSIGDTIQVDRGFFASRLRHLQNCAFVLCALDAAPSKDRIIEWAREELWQHRGIQVEQIRILARGCYLIVTGSADQQHKALMDGPYKLNGRMVFAFP